MDANLLALNGSTVVVLGAGVVDFCEGDEGNWMRGTPGRGTENTIIT